MTNNRIKSQPCTAAYPVTMSRTACQDQSKSAGYFREVRTENGSQNTRVFIDDGWSWAQILQDRRSSEMMELAEKGRIDALIVRCVPACVTS